MTWLERLKRWLDPTIEIRENLRATANTLEAITRAMATRQSVWCPVELRHVDAVGNGPRPWHAACRRQHPVER